MAMIRYFAVISYDGGDYYGFQRLNDRANIQKTIEKALKGMTQQEILVFVSGRTDKGVHAIGQVVHFDTEIDLDNEVWVNGINRRLPESIRVVKVKRVKGDMHARHSAKSKVYEYKISKVPSTPFSTRYETYYPNVDINKLTEACKLLEGTHDFAGFSVYIKDKPTEKTIYSIKVKETKNHITIRFHGDSFLRYMIRRMVGLLIEISTNKRKLSDIEMIFLTKDRKIASKTAPAKGLYLVKVFY